MACPQVGLIRGLLLSGLRHVCPAHGHHKRVPRPPQGARLGAEEAAGVAGAAASAQPGRGRDGAPGLLPLNPALQDTGEKGGSGPRPSPGLPAPASSLCCRGRSPGHGEDGPVVAAMAEPKPTPKPPQRGWTGSSF